MKINPRLKAELKKIALAKMREAQEQVTITSACELTQPMLKQITDMVPQIAGSDIKVIVDEQLLGGIVIRRGSKMIDMSLRSQLHTLETKL